MIILGVDLGDRRIGFAVSDEKERLAVPSGFAPVKNVEQALAAVVEKAGAEKAGKIVLGHPINMDGRPGPKAKEAQAFRDMLTEAGHDVVLWDERLTTSEASRLLKSAGLDRKRRKSLIDANSAQRLLESHLEWRRRNNAATVKSVVTSCTAASDRESKSIARETGE